jgi:hypothetical protein
MTSHCVADFALLVEIKRWLIKGDFTCLMVQDPMAEIAPETKLLDAKAYREPVYALALERPSQECNNRHGYADQTLALSQAVITIAVAR